MAKRKDNGTFVKGQSGNPGGRSAEREELRRYLRETFGLAAVQGIATMAGLVKGKRAAKTEKVKLDAYKWLGDQAIGKAAQAITGPDGGPLFNLDLSKLTTGDLAQLEALREKLKGTP